MTEAALLAPTEGTLPLNRRDPKGFRGWYLVGKKTWKEEQDGRDRNKLDLFYTSIYEFLLSQLSGNSLPVYIRVHL